MKIYKLVKILSIICILLFVLVGCAPKYLVILENNKNISKERESTYIGGRKFEIHKDGGFDGEEIYVLKSESGLQNESIIIKTKSGEIIVFDGGRIEDAEFLLNTINELGSKVSAWFITHCHDDHIGAIIEILDKYKNEIFIENIYYQFPDVSWAYKYIDVNAGIITLFNMKLDEYKEYIDKENIEFDINIHDKLAAKDIYEIDGVSVTVMNDMYKIEEDPINNTSIVYNINIEDKNILLLGDLSYEGGMRLIEENDDLKSDFVVMSHHGQAGAGKELYEKIDPSYCIWCTTPIIFNNAENKYETDNTKDWMMSMNVKKHFILLKNSILIK